MIRLVTLCLGAVLLPGQVFAQERLSLACPLEHASGREPKEPFSWDPPDMKIIMMSQSDTLVRSAYEGRVSNISKTEDGFYELVIYHANYYFWYYNVTRPLVAGGQAVRSGQHIGVYTPGSELEFRVFRNETLLDPRGWLQCRIARAN